MASEVDNPKFTYAAAPKYGSGRIFAVVIEPSVTCPLQIDDESGYEKGYWGKFDKNFETSSHCHITSRDFRVVGGVPFRIIDAVREGAPGTNEQFFLEVALTPGMEIFTKRSS